ncbi:MAG TPA: PPA1309 family protein [Pseudonocardiaceae bacterium]
MSAESTTSDLIPALPAIAREVEDFVASAGWDQQPQLFALVRTSELLANEPSLADQLNPQAPLTPVAQDPLPEGDLAESLARITWPETVSGCALAQEIVVLPPEVEAELPDETDQEAIERFVAEHPQRQEARLVAAVLRDGTGACVLRLRGHEDEPDQVIEHPDLAPNLVAALLGTLS